MEADEEFLTSEYTDLHGRIGLRIGGLEAPGGRGSPRMNGPAWCCMALESFDFHEATLFGGISRVIVRSANQA
jgi:hypothetical protein